MRLTLILLAFVVLIAGMVFGARAVWGGRPQPHVPAPVATPAAGAAAAATLDFTKDTADVAPTGWDVRTHGPGRPPQWTVVKVEGVGQALQQGDDDSTNHRYNVLLAPAPTVADVRVSARARAVRGARDRSFGVVARWQEGNTYYLVRCNTSGWGSNVRIYRFTNGEREELIGTEVEAVPETWYDIAIEVRGDRILAIFNGQQVLEFRDPGIASAGRVGVWTKSESVSQFANLTVTPLGAP